MHPKEKCKLSGKRQAKVRIPVNDLRNDKEHSDECLKTIGIDRPTRPITGYTGEEWKKILTDHEPAVWLKKIKGHGQYDSMLQSLSMLKWGELSCMRE